MLLDGVDLAAVPPHRRPVNMMFQSYALFPHLNVEANIAFGLKQEGLDRARDRPARRRHAGAGRSWKASARRKPHQLSGGQRQRVALARSLVKRPRVLLLDEPMAALDKKLRGETQFELMELQRSLGLTFIIVTHDQSEAMTVADRIGVMDRGRLMQVAPPAEIYERPNSRWVADFIGDVNLFEGRLGDDGLSVEGHRGRPPARAPKPTPSPARWSGSRCGRRRCASAANRRLPGLDNCVARHGGRYRLSRRYLDLQAAHPRRLAGERRGRQYRRSRASPQSAVGEQVWLSWPAEAAIVLTR